MLGARGEPASAERRRFREAERERESSQLSCQRGRFSSQCLRDGSLFAKRRLVTYLRFGGVKIDSRPQTGITMANSFDQKRIRWSNRVLRTALMSSIGILMLGTVPQSARAQTYTVLYNFSGFADGGNPYGGVILDGQGNSYGTTVAGGATGNGTVFKIDSTGAETVLHSFAGGSDGRSPLGSLVLDGKGHLYGTTYYGGPDDTGTVFEVNSVTGV